MTDFICFGSGSSGNCYYLRCDGFGLVIDLGIGIRAFKKYFRDYGLPQAQIGGILVTHDHTDHVKSVGTLSNEFHLPVYSSKEVHAGMQRNYFMTRKIGRDEVRPLAPGETVQAGPFTVTIFPVPHDSAGNNGYFIEGPDASLCLITDAGHVTPEMRTYLSRARYVVLEANYDESMLQNGPYPRYLKRRISGDAGHLCNDVCASTLAECLRRDARHVWLCHLSEENNHPELARKTVAAALVAAGFDVDGALQLEALKRTVASPLYVLD